MASVYRPTVIRYYDRDGKRCTKATPGARKRREKSDTYRGRYCGPDGKPKTVSLCDDKEGADEMLARLVQRAKREARGDIDPFEDHRQRPLAEHLEDFRAFLESKGNTSEHVALTVSRVTAAFEGCQFKKLADLNAGRVAGLLSDRRKGKKGKGGEEVAGLSVASSNHHLGAVKSFGSWLVKDRRWPENPFAHLSRLNAKVDVRRERRAMSADELGRVIAAAEQSEKTFRGLDGAARAMLYRLATMTGLRASELASLTQESFDLDAAQPIVTLKASYSKHRREDVLPLREDLVAQLREWFSERKRVANGQDVILSIESVSGAKREPLFPGTWPEKAAKMFRGDLKTARLSWLKEAKGDVGESKRRSESSFLCPVDADGCVCDFHGLRHTFISNLAAGGVHPKVAQQLARHSTIGLTMDRYTHLRLSDMTAGLAALPLIVGSESVSCRATGTLDESVESFGCTNGCTRTGATNRFQPLPTVSDQSANDAGEEMEKPRFLAENEAFCGDSTAEVEGTPRGIRTPDLRIRNPLLYPTELWARVCAATTGVKSVRMAWKHFMWVLFPRPIPAASPTHGIDGTNRF